MPSIDVFLNSPILDMRPEAGPGEISRIEFVRQKGRSGMGAG